MMAKLMDRRHRITLMSEAVSIGAGGRSVVTTPLIGDVWAAVSAHGSHLVMQGGRQTGLMQVSFTVAYAPEYLFAKSIRFKNLLYQVKSWRRMHHLLDEITFETSQISETLEGSVP